MGTPFRVLLEEHGGGVLEGKALKAWTPGGSSTPMLTAEHLDVGHGLRVDRRGRLAARHRRRDRDGRGRLHGRGRPPARAVLRARVLRQVHAVPRGHLVGDARARSGSKTGYGRDEDLPLLDEVGQNILFRAFCALADGAVSPISSTLKYFRDEYEEHVRLGPLSSSSTGLGGGDVSAKLVTLTIDGKEVTVPAGTLIIRAAEQLGIEIPRFCDHPLLEPVGACRQCYVEIEGQRKLFTSCTTTVAPGMVVRTQNTSDQVHEAQVANLEFLLLNHPLDCPICDRGGECPLQDQALAFGPGESRYIEAKRTYPKPLALSPLVDLDRERCVLCARCTRFCDEISGDRFIELFARGAGEQVCDRRRRGLPLAVQREHGADLPGRRAHRHALPVRRAAVRPLDGRHRVPALQRRLQHEAGHAPRRGRAAARARQPRGERRLALRQGAVRVPVPGRARPGDHAPDPRSRAGAGVVRRGADGRRRAGARASASRSSPAGG